MAVIDASFQIDGSLLCLSEVSIMTLIGSFTSDEGSLSSLECILSTPGAAICVLRSSFQSCFH